MYVSVFQDQVWPMGIFPLTGVMTHGENAQDIGPLPRAGLFWYCGGTLHTRIRQGARGVQG